jgi:hypothetical protein
MFDPRLIAVLLGTSVNIFMALAISLLVREMRKLAARINTLEHRLMRVEQNTVLLMITREDPSSERMLRASEVVMIAD